MHTPWSDPAIREELDEEIRLLILALYEAAAEETRGKMDVEGHGASSLLDHARQLRVWSLAALYTPWMARPLESGKLLTQAERHLEACRRHQHTLDVDNGQERNGSNFERAIGEHIALLDSVACASIAGLVGARDYLEQLLAAHERQWWEPRYGLISPCPRTRQEKNNAPELTATLPLPPFNLSANVHAMGTYLRVAEASGERVWADRARSIAYGLHRALPPHVLAERIALVAATGERQKDAGAHIAMHTADSALHASIETDEASAIYFRWVRNLLHLRAHLEDVGDEPSEWIFSDATKLYRWTAEKAWQTAGGGYAPSCVSALTSPDNEHRLLAPLAEAASAAQALGKTLEHCERGDERIEQLSEEFAIALAWADRHLRRAPGHWEQIDLTASKSEGDRQRPPQSPEDLSVTLDTLLPPFLLVRLPLAPSIPTALAHGCVAPWDAEDNKG